MNGNNIRNTYKELKHNLGQGLHPWPHQILEIPIRNWNDFSCIEEFQGKIDIRNTYKELKLISTVTGIDKTVIY